MEKKKNNNLLGFHNKSHSLYVEILLKGKKKNKVCLTLVERDDKDKAKDTVQFYLDISVAVVLSHDLWDGTFFVPNNPSYDVRGFSSYKEFNGTKRGLFLDRNPLRVTIQNTTGDTDKKEHFFNLSMFQARQLARTIIDYMRAVQTAFMLKK